MVSVAGILRVAQQYKQSSMYGKKCVHLVFCFGNCNLIKGLAAPGILVICISALQSFFTLLK